jgi:hypothetical protein
MRIHTRYATVNNVELVGENITFRRYTSVHADMPYGNAKLTKVDNLPFTWNKSSAIVLITFNRDKHWFSV